MRGLVRFRCGKEGNKYWLDKEYKEYIFCGIGINCMEHYMEECSKVCSWFRELGKDKEEIWKKLWSEELDSIKCKVLGKLEKEKKRSGKGKRKEKQLAR